MVRWFIGLYVNDIVEEEVLDDDDDDYERNMEIMKTQVFHAWRDDLDNRRPGKERALIQVEL